MTNEIRGYFERYGEVESIHFRSHEHSGFRYGFIKFKNAADAATVLSKPRHRIGGCVVRVKAAHTQPDGSESSEESNDGFAPDYYTDSEYYYSDY